MNQPRHFCFICDEYPPAIHGGTGSSYRDLAEGLAAAGHRVTVAGVYLPGRLKVEHETDEMIHGVRVVRLPLSPRWLRYKAGALADRWRLKQWLVRAHRRQPFDLIEASDFGGWLPFGNPAAVPTVIRMRGSNLFFDSELGRPGNPFEHRLERQSVARASFLGAVSRYVAGRMLSLCGLSDRSATVIYNAVDTGLFSPSDAVPAEKGLVVYVNYINPKKGIEQLLDAMHVVCRRHPQARLIALGKDTQKPSGGVSYLDQLRGRIHPDFQHRITFTGPLPRPEVLAHLRRAEVCCYPSHMETFGIAPVEAMSVGKPTIFSKTGPGPEIIEHGVSGLLCDPYDAKDIAAKILSVLDHPAEAARMGAAARQRVLDGFDKNRWIQRNLDFFESCLHSR